VVVAEAVALDAVARGIESQRIIGAGEVVDDADLPALAQIEAGVAVETMHGVVALVVVGVALDTHLVAQRQERRLRA